MAEKKTEAVMFLNKLTNKKWSVNVGTAAHKRMKKGVAAGDYELVDAPKRQARKSEPSDKE